MSKPKASAQQPSVAPSAPEKTRTLIGLEKSKDGYLPVVVTVRGDRVVEEKKYGPPELKQIAARRLQLLVSQKLLFPNGR